MKPFLAALCLAASTATAAAQGVPTIDVTPSCRAAAAVNVGITQDYDACRRSEGAAREALVKQWSNFRPADRASCYSLTTTGSTGTYTELLTCLEMKRDARNLPAVETGTVGVGTRRRQ